MPLQNIQMAAISALARAAHATMQAARQQIRFRGLPSETATVMAEAPLVGSMTTMKVVLSSLPLKEVICSRTANVKACLSIRLQYHRHRCVNLWPPPLQLPAVGGTGSPGSCQWVQPGKEASKGCAVKLQCQHSKVWLQTTSPLAGAWCPSAASHTRNEEHLLCAQH